MTRPIITLTTDFGESDGFVGVMKGVILGIARDAQLIDLSHQIQPQNIRQAGFILQRHVWHFPPGTVHLAVVDPGVGTARRAIAAHLGQQIFVAPDNGLLTPLLADAEAHGWPVEIVHTDQPAYWRTDISSTFHGRDIFAPLAAHLAAGVPLRDLGTAIDDPVRLPQPQPARTAGGWQAEVVHIDHFGTLVSNLTRAMLGDAAVKQVSIADTTITRIVGTFADAPPGELVAQFSSQGHLEVARVNGSAATQLNAQIGDTLTVEVT